MLVIQFVFLFVPCFTLYFLLDISRYAGEHGIMKYIKIAAMLDRKTVRDVALRCRWLAVSYFIYPILWHAVVLFPLYVV